MEGIDEASVNFASEKLSVTYDENNVSEIQIKAVVEKLGYGFVDKDSMR